MFQFRRCPPTRLCIHLVVTTLDGGRVSPFGFPRIIACLQLPVAFRRWPRPSSARCPKASTMRPCSAYSLKTMSDPSALALETPLSFLGRLFPSAVFKAQLRKFLVSSSEFLVAPPRRRSSPLESCLVVRLAPASPSGFTPVVDAGRLELPTSCVQSRRSPN